MSAVRVGPRPVVHADVDAGPPTTGLAAQVLELHPPGEALQGRRSTTAAAHMPTWQSTVDTLSRPAACRILSWWLGDATTFAADRATAAALTIVAPTLPALARTAQRFRGDVVRDALQQHGFCQVLDLAAGIPPRAEQPTPVGQHDASGPATLICVEQNPVAVRLLLDAADDHTTVVLADLTTPDALLDLLRDRDVLDCAAPVLVLLTMAVHHLTGFQTWHLLHVLYRRLAPGSCLVLTAFVSDPLDAPTRDAILTAYTATPDLHLHRTDDLQHQLTCTGWRVDTYPAPAGLFTAVAWLPEAP
jgi:hypothetical protein